MFFIRQIYVFVLSFSMVAMYSRVARTTLLIPLSRCIFSYSEGNALISSSRSEDSFHSHRVWDVKSWPLVGLPAISGLGSIHLFLLCYVGVGVFEGTAIFCVTTR